MTRLAVDLEDRELASYLEHVFHVGFEPAKRKSSGAVAAVRAKDLPYPNGFAVEVRTSWRRIEAAFVLESYAPQIAKSMGAASEEAKRRFSKMHEALVLKGVAVELLINGMTVGNIHQSSLLPWSSIGLKVSKLASPSNERTELQQKAHECCLAVGALALTLLPLEDSDDDGNVVGLPEGAVARVLVNKYERSAANRAACICCFGAACQACGFVFRDVYGEIGDGFIEVHHRTPVSTIGPGYVIDPVQDLVPLCANCHAMIHRTNPPLPLDELRKLIRARVG